MFSLMQPGPRPPVEEPRYAAPDAASPAFPVASPPPVAAADEADDWPKDVHLPDEGEEEEC